MNAVNLFRNVEDFFDRNHNLFIRFGGLFALVFFTLYVPFTMQRHMLHQYEAQQATSIALANELDLLSHQVEFLNLSFEKQQAVMREVECLAQNIYFEAGSEPTAGKIAVATVTLNRVKEGFARSVCAVVKQKRNGICQFSWVCQDNKSIRSKSEYKEAQKIAQNILISKRNYGTMDNALYFHADYVNPNWKQTKEFVKKIGRHLFYKES
jgi:spore germination cell wall hydrolase CwlJ-like protein